MPDICDVILDDHEAFRRRFAELDEQREDPAALARLWPPLATLLDLHAAAEEEVLYPLLVREGANGDEETTDAISDHNAIRDAVARAGAAEVGSGPWWDAVAEAREQNSDHMAEEERAALADFRREVEDATRDELGSRFTAYKDRHAGGRDLPVEDRDPGRYVREQQR